MVALVTDQFVVVCKFSWSAQLDYMLWQQTSESNVFL